MCEPKLRKTQKPGKEGPSSSLNVSKDMTDSESTKLENEMIHT